MYIKTVKISKGMDHEYGPGAKEQRDIQTLELFSRTHFLLKQNDCDSEFCKIEHFIP